MRPLQALAMGLVVVAVNAQFGRFDALPDPLGWALVLVGVAGLPRDLERRGVLLGLAALAGVVSVPLWWPGVTDALYDVDDSLGWAANLPQLAFAALLSLVLARRGGEAGDRRAAAWGRTAATCFVVAAALPVLVFGGDLATLEQPAYVFASLALVVLVCLLFAWSGRSWIQREERPVDWTGA